MASLLLTPLQQILNAHSDDLTERELRQQLAEAGFRATPPEIRGALHSRPDLFVSLTDGRWRLKSVLQAEEVVVGDREIPRERGTIITPTITQHPSFTHFIAFDVETTGIHAERDRIIQISAVRITNEAPVALTTATGESLTRGRPTATSNSSTNAGSFSIRLYGGEMISVFLPLVIRQ